MPARALDVLDAHPETRVKAAERIVAFEVLGELLTPALPFDEGDQATWENLIQGWQTAGATHISINTMECGFNTPAKHLAAIKKFAAHIQLPKSSKLPGNQEKT